MNDDDQPSLLVVHLLRDGGIVVPTEHGPTPVSTSGLVSTLRQAVRAGRRVELRGHVRRRINRPVVDAAKAAVPDVQIRPTGRRQDLATDPTDGLVNDGQIRADLLERARQTNSLDDLIRAAVRDCNVEAIKILRRAAADPGPPIPPGARPDAVSVEPSRRPHLIIGAGFLALLWGWFIITLILGSGASFSARFLTAIIGSFVVVAIVGYIASAGWQRVCLDGSKVWTKRMTRPWRGPIDLRNAVGCAERARRGYLYVVLFEPSDAGRSKSVDGLDFSAEQVRKLDAIAPLAAVEIEVSKDHLLPGLARHLGRYLDIERCEIGQHRRVWQQ